MLVEDIDYKKACKAFLECLIYINAVSLGWLSHLFCLLGGSHLICPIHSNPEG